jgi:hypothetical protein
MPVGLMVLKSATGKAFHTNRARVQRIATLVPKVDFSTTANSAVAICSKVTADRRPCGDSRLGCPSVGEARRPQQPSRDEASPFPSIVTCDTNLR